MTPVLTEEFLRNNHVYFQPQTLIEAEYIQRRLLAMGLVWASGAIGIQQVNEALARGMNVDHGGKIYIGEDKDRPYTRARAQDFPDFNPEDILTMHEQFALLRAEVTVLHQKMDRILAILEPQSVQKPAPHGRVRLP